MARPDPIRYGQLLTALQDISGLSLTELPGAPPLPKNDFYNFDYWQRHLGSLTIGDQEFPRIERVSTDFIVKSAARAEQHFSDVVDAVDAFIAALGDAP
ncbi:MAG: hypothetical protein WBD05_08410 [Phycisphaerae bacterium]